MVNQFYKDQINILLQTKEMNYSDYLKNKYNEFKYICVFGVGNLGRYLPERLNKYGIKVDFFCDNDSKKVNNIYDGIKCISVEELMAYKQETVIIIATRYFKQIYNQLNLLGFPYLDRILDNKFDVDIYLENESIVHVAEELHKVMDILDDEESIRILTRIIEEWCKNEYVYGQLDDIFSENQYFDNNIIKMSEKEVFVDCGAYIGDTLECFLENNARHFMQTYLFELSSSNFLNLKKKLNIYDATISDRLVLVNSGVSNITSEILYNEDDEGSVLSSAGNVKGHVVRLDDYFEEKDVTFIKMDIEGAELQALNGAEQLIKRCAPKLAICLYHKPQDLWEIPLYLKKINPDYKIYIRHYTDLLNETVCYAIV